MFQELVVMPVKAGIALEAAQRTLDQAQALGESNLKIMRTKKIDGDVSFLVNLKGTIYLASYSLSECQLQHWIDVEIKEKFG